MRTTTEKNEGNKKQRSHEFILLSPHFKAHCCQCRWSLFCIIVVKSQMEWLLLLLWLFLSAILPICWFVAAIFVIHFYLIYNVCMQFILIFFFYAFCVLFGSNSLLFACLILCSYSFLFIRNFSISMHSKFYIIFMSLLPSWSQSSSASLPLFLFLFCCSSCCQIATAAQLSRQFYILNNKLQIENCELLAFMYAIFH